jgi:hypothetical protein
MNNFALLDKAKHNPKTTDLTVVMFTTVNMTTLQLHVARAERYMAQSVVQSVDWHTGLVCIVDVCVIVSSRVLSYLRIFDWQWPRQWTQERPVPSGRTSQGNHNCNCQAHFLIRYGQEPHAEWGRGRGAGLTPRRTDQLPAAEWLL